MTTIRPSLKSLPDYFKLGVAAIHSTPCVEIVLEALGLVVTPPHTLPHLLASVTAAMTLVRLMRYQADAQKTSAQ